MTSRERFEAVVNGTGPDRVPVMCQLSVGHIIKNSGIAPADFFLDYTTACVEPIVRLMNQYHFDGVIVEAPGVDSAALRSEVGRIEDKADGQLIVWKNGDETFCPVNDYSIFRPKVPLPRKTLLETTSDDMLPHDGYRKSLSQLPGYFMQPYRDVLSRIGETYTVHSYFVSPLSLFIHIFGIQDALMGLMDYPDQCSDLLNGIADGCIRWSDNLIDSGMPVVGIAAPFEGRSFMSLPMFEQFGVPFTAKVVSHIKARSITTYMHMCGHINDRLEAIVDTGVTGIECMDPPPLGNTDLADAVKRIGGKVFLKGNMDPVNTVLHLSPEEIYQDACSRIRIAKDTGRYILSTACSVCPDTPADHLTILHKAAEDVGVY